jgi:hypothetical protein
MRSATHTVTWTCHGSCDSKGTESQGVCNGAMLQAAARLCSPGVFRDLEQQPAKVVVGWALQGAGAAITPSPSATQFGSATVHLMRR